MERSKRVKLIAKTINRLAANKINCTKSYTELARLARALEYVRDWLLQTSYADEEYTTDRLYELAEEKLVRACPFMRDLQ